MIRPLYSYNPAVVSVAVAQNAQVPAYKMIKVQELRDLARNVDIDVRIEEARLCSLLGGVDEKRFDLSLINYTRQRFSLVSEYIMRSFNQIYRSESVTAYPPKIIVYDCTNLNPDGTMKGGLRLRPDGNVELLCKLPKFLRDSVENNLQNFLGCLVNFGFCRVPINPTQLYGEFFNAIRHARFRKTTN